MKMVTIHTDGGCKGNPGPGGWAAVLRYGEHVREISGGAQHTTNNRMELQAAIEGLNSLKEACQVIIFTDSMYVRDGISKWIKTWKRNGWKTADKKPVKNEELWRRLDELTLWHKVEWRWVKGHAGNPDNERCDRLAQQRIKKMKKKLKARQRKMPAPAPLKPAIHPAATSPTQTGTATYASMNLHSPTRR